MQDAASRPAISDLTGQWRVIHDVQKSELARYVGLKIEFQMSLSQHGDQVSGVGEKFLVDWQLATREEASRLEVAGRVEERDIRLSLLESPPHHPERKIVGEIIWRAEDPDRMVGSFRVDHAATSGRSEALRRPA